MAKKKDELTPREQAERFRKAVQDLVDAGELSPTEADEKFERAMDKIVPHSGESSLPRKR